MDERQNKIVKCSIGSVLFNIYELQVKTENYKIRVLAWSLTYLQLELDSRILHEDWTSAINKQKASLKTINEIVSLKACAMYVCNFVFVKILGLKILGQCSTMFL